MEKYELENLDDIDLEMLHWIISRLINSPEMSISKYIKNSERYPEITKTENIS